MIKGTIIWDQSGIRRIIGIMLVSLCLEAILILEYLDFPFGYSGIYSGIYSGMYSRLYSHSGISQMNAP